jgi:hypothetical protein
LFFLFYSHESNSKSLEYLGTSQDGNITLRVDVWLEEVKNKDKFKVTFFLEDKEKVNKDGTKKQYINSIGSCSWAADANDLPSWFASREYRVAFVGEEDLYNFMRTWLGDLNYAQDTTSLQLEWKKLMKGNVKELTDQINGEFSTNVVALATVNVKEKDGEIKEYQTIYNKGFLPAYCLKNFRLVDYSSEAVLKMLGSKKNKDLKPYERFALTVMGSYGCRDVFDLKDLHDYVASDHLVSSNSPIEEDSSEY